MTKHSNPFFVKAATCAVLGAMAALAIVSCKKDGARSKPADVDYYTCTMHPSVRSKVPGKCPICGMDLVPVKKKSATNSQTSAAVSGTSGMSGMETGTNLEAEQPSEFMVPVERQQQIGVTFGNVENQPFSPYHSRRRDCRL